MLQGQIGLSARPVRPFVTRHPLVCLKCAENSEVCRSLPRCDLRRSNICLGIYESKSGLSADQYIHKETSNVLDLSLLTLISAKVLRGTRKYKYLSATWKHWVTINDILELLILVLDSGGINFLCYTSVDI